MKKIFLFVLLAVTAGLFSTKYYETDSLAFTPDSLSVLAPKDYYPEETEIVNSLVSRYHYKKFKLNDSLSSEIFDRYIEALDHNKSYFLLSDINKFEQYKNQLDDFLLKGELNAVYEIFKVYRNRVNDRFDYIENIIKESFDFSKDEYYEVDRKDAQWSATDEEANEIWRKRIKNDALNLKLAGKDPDSIIITLSKRYENYRKAINQYDSEDVYQLFMNSYTQSIDPHTNYFSPLTSENFKINMSLSLEGIGAQLQQEDDYIKIVEIIPGGPAYKSNKLKRNDKIVGVAQGEDGEMVDIIGWRVTDAVQIIRGPKGTTVRLLILPADAGINAIPKEIKLVRDKVKLEEQAAKKEILDFKQDNINYKIGVIKIPTFYSDFEAQQKGDKNYRSTTRDVKKIIEELKAENVDGIIIDLRNNGGGALNEAIDLTGLFIKDGPVVQVRNSDGSVQVGADSDPDIVYEGPLAVLVNKFSASASEIFSGAIQDYERGLIIGEQTYGKGTVQNLIDLNRVMQKSDDKLGQVKVTIAKYYRINGGSTQSLGVIPDITLPSSIHTDEFGESSEESALPWDEIKPTKYKIAGNVKDFLSLLNSKHKERIEASNEFDYLLEDIKESKEERNRNQVSLNEEIRKKEMEKEEEEKFQRENERRKTKGIKLLNKGEEIKESSAPEDLYLDESARVLADLIVLSIG
ncbi:MAG: tail-specific protease [Ignavibacteria bacterium RBG_16_34_14]|nr:MAG: tail-specific protease [Ignavibacteria bacterium RBG_16_34_14]